MFATIVELSQLEFSKVKFFSVLIEGRDHSEFLDFQHRIRPLHSTQLGELNMLIKEIGEIYGARSQFFRDERQAEALPPEYFEYSTDEENPENKFGLRLYCIRANSTVAQGRPCVGQRTQGDGSARAVDVTHYVTPS